MANEFKIKKGLIVTGASGGTVVDIQGSQGQLFSVTDDLSGSIFAVSDISGVPILDINSSGLSTFAGTVTSSTFLGDLNGTINTATTGTTQTAGNNSTLIATTAYADAAAAAIPIGNYLPLSAGSSYPLTGALHFGDDYNYIEKNASSDMLMVANRHITFSDVISGVVNERMRIEEGGNVGIGTTSPFALLTLKRDTGIGFEQTITTNVDTRRWWIQNDIVEYGDFLIRTASAKDASTPDLTRLYINSSGNVGIGTTSPAQLLDVNGIADINSIIIGTHGDNMYHNGSDFYIKTETAHALIFRTSNTNRLTIKAGGDAIFTGNVGIGTTSPSAKLEVNGALFVGDHTGTVTPTDGIWIEGADGAETQIQMYSLNGSVFHVKNAATKATIGYASSQDRSVNFTNTGTGNISVGIGTTSPDALFDVADRVEIDTYDSSTAASNAFLSGYLRIIAGGKTGWGVDDELGKIEFYGEDGSGVGARTAASIIAVCETGNGTSTTTFSSGLAFYTSPYNAAQEERIRVTATGNVGIGTTTPLAKLDIQGTQGQLFSVTDNLSGSIFAVADISGVPIFDVNSSGVSYFDGKVGIGISNPIAPLHITGPAPIATQPVIKVERNSPVVDYQDTNPTNGYLFFTERFSNLAGSVISTRKVQKNPGGEGVYTNFNHGSLGGQGTEHIQKNNSFHWKIDNTTNEVLTINTSGNVGIGTTGPNAKLNVNGGIKIEGTNSLSFGGTVSIPAWGINSSGNDLIINDQATTVGDVLLTNAGNVGIGTTSPSYKLDVSGNGRFTSTVTAANFILSSDERLKENIEKACDNRIKADWKTFELKTDKGQKRYGVIAQELEKTNPEFVREDTQGFKSVAYIDLLIAKIAELEARLEKLEK